jgi:hypothetical protein
VYLPAAVGCLAVAALLTWAAATHAPALRVPPTIALILAGVLVAATCRLVELHRRAAGSGDGTAAVIFAGTAIFALWVALGSGTRACRVGVDRPPFVPASGLACRIPFGIAGVLATATAIYAVTRWMRARRAGAGDIDR